MSIFENATDAAQATIQSICALQPKVENAAQMVARALVGGNKLMVCGNGGSAGDAADFATEFTCRFVNDRRPYPAINLSACGSLLTAIGNDYGFDQVFARQVRGLGQPGDLLVAISTSGNSANILAALETARDMGVESIALLGRDGGKAKGIGSLDLIIPSEQTARIQEGHKFLLHVICEIVEPQLLPERPR